MSIRASGQSSRIAPGTASGRPPWGSGATFSVSDIAVASGASAYTKPAYAAGEPGCGPLWMRSPSDGTSGGVGGDGAGSPGLAVHHQPRSVGASAPASPLVRPTTPTIVVAMTATAKERLIG